mmetsp:Transcript_3736/g.9328  ORF Transcript_3736/g.9328 Transcript_3736/m.9328 type:complete len:202 (-) Transcript_3736:93-698(-)
MCAGHISRGKHHLSRRNLVVRERLLRRERHVLLVSVCLGGRQVEGHLKAVFVAVVFPLGDVNPPTRAGRLRHRENVGVDVPLLDEHQTQLGDALGNSEVVVHGLAVSGLGELPSHGEDTDGHIGRHLVVDELLNAPLVLFVWFARHGPNGDGATQWKALLEVDTLGGPGRRDAQRHHKCALDDVQSGVQERVPVAPRWHDG